MQRDLVGNRFEFAIKLDTRDIRETDTKARTVPASLSSESPVSRPWGREILVHDEKAIDLSRADDGLPLLWNHATDQPIGIVERIKIENGKLRGLLRFSKNSKANEIFRDVADGFLRDLSIGYQIKRFEETANSDEIRVTEWELLEASVVTVPSDKTVGINRSFSGGNSVTTETQTPENAGTQTTLPPVVDMSRAHVLSMKAGAKEAVINERKRVADLHELFDLAIVPRTDFYANLRARAVDEGWPVDGARNILMQAMSGESEPAADWSTLTDQRAGARVATHEGRLPPVVLPGNTARTLGGNIQMGEDALTKFRNGAELALLVRGGIESDKAKIQEAKSGGLIGMKLGRMAEQYLRTLDIETKNLSDEDMVGRAFTTRASGMTTSDFTNILANTASKSLLRGWDEAPEVWDRWTRRGNLSDFKVADRAGLSGFTDLDEVPENGDISYGKMTDRKETIRLVEYAKKFRLTRRTIINDDLSAFSDIPRKMGRAASRKVGDLAYAVLEGVGPTLNQDSLALFHSTHANYTLAATAPTVATLEVARAAMAKKTDPNTGGILNIRGRYLLVPVALETTARTLVASQYDPAGTAGTLTPNPFNGGFEVIADARMDGQTNGTAAWVMSADPNIYDTVEVAFLNGVAEPYIREEQEWDTRGVEYVVGVDCGVAVLDFRGFHKYRGS